MNREKEISGYREKWYYIQKTLITYSILANRQYILQMFILTNLYQ